MQMKMQGMASTHGQPQGIQTYQSYQQILPQHRVTYQRPSEMMSQDLRGAGDQHYLSKKEEKESHYSRHMSSKASFGNIHGQQNPNQDSNQEHNQESIDQMDGNHGDD
jgi:hypothetical protein